MKIKKFFTGLFLVALIFLPLLSLAQGGVEGTTGSGVVALENPLSGVSTLPQLLTKILNIMVTIGVPIVTLGIIWSGFLYVTAQGNEGKLKTARNAIVGTLIGAAIVLGAFVISAAIEATMEQVTGGISVSSGVKNQT